MGEKISGYATEATALTSGDLIDVSKEISVSPSVYESQKANVSLLANWNIFGQDLTMSAPRLHNLSNNQLSLTNGRFLLKGSDDLSTDLLTLENLSGSDIVRFQNDGTLNTEVSINWNLNNNSLGIINSDFGVIGAASVIGDGNYSNVFKVVTSTNVPLFIADDINNNVAIGATIAETTSLLELNSTTKGFLKPRMTTGERDLIISPATGLEIFNSITNQTEFYDGSAWNLISRNISSNNLTWVGSTTQDLATNVLTFKGGTLNVEGSDTLSSSTVLSVYDGDITPSQLWAWKANGDIEQFQDSVLYLGDNKLTFNYDIDTATEPSPLNFEFGGFWQGYTRWDDEGAMVVKSSGSGYPLTVLKKTDTSLPVFRVQQQGGGFLSTGNALNWRFSETTTSTRYITIEDNAISWYRSSLLMHSIKVDSTNSGVHFFEGGITGSLGYFIVGGTAITGTGKISLNETVSMDGNPTYADDTAAGVGGLLKGDIYQTVTGEVRVKL